MRMMIEEEQGNTERKRAISREMSKAKNGNVVSFLF